MYFCTRFERKISGVLAQVARAFDWQSKGHEFDSHILHKEEPFLRLFFCIYFFNPAGWVSVNLEGVTVEMGAIFKEGTGGGGAVEGVAVFGFEL